MIQHPVVHKLHNYYLTQTFFLVFYYVFLVIAIWQGPYGFNKPMLVWLACVAFYPFAVFPWSFFQIHILMRNIKQSHLEIINSKVQGELTKVLNGQNLKGVGNLEKL
jgi:hypothetical protein